jgi:DNA-binding IclR family transcriptional regulator
VRIGGEVVAVGTTAAKSAGRALDVLQVLARAGAAMTANDIALACGIPKSSAYELLKVMQDRRFVEYTPGPRTWSLDVATLEVAAAYRRSGVLQRKSWIHLARLTEETGHTSHLAVLDGPEVVYLAKREPVGGAIRLVTEVGTRLPARQTAVGKAILSHLASDELEVLFGATAEADRVPACEPLLAELCDVRRRGFAEDIGGVTAGITCVAAPVFSSDAKVIAAVGVSYVSATQDAVGHAETTRLTLQIARDLTHQLVARSDQESVDPGSTPRVESA